MKYFIHPILAIPLVVCASNAPANFPHSAVDLKVSLWINGQLIESEAWDDSLSGGYLFRFSADVWGDADAEHFVTTSSGFSPRAGWLVYSKQKPINGGLELSAYEFLVIREGDASIFPSWSTSGGHTMLVQTWDKHGVNYRSQPVHHEELGKFIQDCKARGQVIRPRLEMLRLVDYLNGSRDWEPVDLRTEEVEFRGNTRSIVLKRDIERLETLNLRPEQALEMFNRMQEPAVEAPSKAKPPTQSRPETASGPAGSPEPRTSSTESPSPSWMPTIVIGVTIVAFIIVVLTRRRRG